MRLSTPVPPKPVLPVLKKLHPMPGKRLWIFMMLLLSAREFFEIAIDDEEEDAPIDRLLEARLPFMKELVRFGTQFIGYRDYAGELEEKLAEANKRADALAIELEQSESAHTKTVEDLQKRLDDAKKALEENVTQHSAREEEILSRLETQSRRFVRRTHQEYELENPEDDELLDALSLLEIHGLHLDFIKCVDIILQSFSRSFFIILCNSWSIMFYFYRQDCLGSMDRKNGVSCVAVFGVVRILHNTLGSSSGQDKSSV
ncbi:hypothetical protein QYE76_052585 [Lolium multiflorum]|uniref:Uncharacterized protein n=1 Tax=Lolium multiflorum TaxID=4521 RepID=A0AAD8SU67_LOLMU|nr:hypothetical protein QYE76_052585 [Lolium multiflorum]